MHSVEGEPRPAVSVLMPTYRQADFVSRAVGSLLDQTFADWELVVVDDGSPDDTAALVAAFRDERIRYHRFERNRGLGEALNTATAMARGRYLAYLPSDDYYDPGHLARAVALLDSREDVYAAYGGLRWWATTTRSRPFRVRLATASLRGDEVVGAEAATLLADRPPVVHEDVRSGNVFALVQVVHRRALDDRVRWVTRTEEVSDRLELDFWRGLAAHGAVFAYTGEVTCEWGDHPDQRHKIISGRGGMHPSHPTGREFGLSRYRQHYGIAPGELLNWQPGFWALPHDQRRRYGKLAGHAPRPSADGLRILLVGELGFNPDRILALADAGHSLYGLWQRNPLGWQTVGPLPFGSVTDVPHDRHWPDRVREIRPDVVYALLNWQALPVIGELLDAGLGIPIVFHFKESPHSAMEMGLWPTLRRALQASAGVIFISQENLDWFEACAGVELPAERVMVLDGDLPSGRWMTDDWAPKLSAADGEIHTVCVGRVRVESRNMLEPVPELARRGIHVHLYGETYQLWSSDWIETGQGSRFLHLHPTVEPDQWVHELSRYDAAWPHVHESSNGGDIRQAHWDDLNLPGRLGTYATAGLPWIVRHHPGSRVALQSVATEHGIGVLFDDLDDLAAKLADRQRLAGLTAAARAGRRSFSFDHHVPALVKFFEQAIEAR